MDPTVEITQLRRQLAEKSERIRALENELEEVYARMRVDSLTGLAVRSWAEQFAEDRRQAGTVALVMIDLDFFKAVNDTYGHAAGDEVLRRVGALLITHTRRTDMPFRYGGEELGILFVDINPAHLAAKLESIRREIERQTFDEYPDLRITASFGFAVIREMGAVSECFKQADRALYASKEFGRNRVTDFADL